MNYENGDMSGEPTRYAIEGESRGHRWLRWAIAGVIALAVAVGAYFWLHHKDAAKDGAKAGAAASAGDSQIPSVTVIEPGASAIRTVLSATGSLAARREMPVGVAGEGGMVTRVLVEPGTWVGAGQVLATVDRSVQTQTADSLAAQIRVAQADAALAQSNLDRSKALVGRGFVSQADIDQKTATRDAAVARVRVAQAQYNETRARNGRLDIRAPAAGLVLTRNVEPGQIVSSGSGTLFRMAKGGEMELRAQLSEGDIAQLKAGVPAEVTPVGSAQAFKGEVWQVSPVIDPQTRQGIARIALKYDPALRPGGFASARIFAGTQTAPLIPQTAVLSDAKGNYVYVLDKDNKTVRRAVTTGDVSDQGVAIVSGLDGSERVVSTAGAFLNPGQKVNPVLQKTGN